MPRRNSVWDLWYEDMGNAPSRSARQVKCLFCSHTMSYRADRMLSHLGYRPRNGGGRDVQVCRLVPPHVRMLFQECDGMVPDRPDVANDVPLHVDDEDEVRGESLLSQSVNDDVELFQNSQTTRALESALVDSEPRELRQATLPEGFNTSVRQLLDRVWSSAFYEANIPFNIIRHPTFVKAVQETARVRMPAYNPPSYNAVRTKLLTNKKADVQREVNVTMGNSISKYGVTICSDGWDNVQNRPLLNVIQSGTKGDVFLGTIDTSGNYKDHFYVASQIRPFLQIVGPENVVQVCTDNAPVMASACRDIMQEIPHLYVQGCAAHCLDLLLEDWGKEDWVRRIVKKGRAICLFIKNHHAPQAIFRRLSPGLAIRLPNETRFATNFLMIERLLQVRQTLEKMVVDDEWHAFIAELRTRAPATHTKGMIARRVIRSDGFWDVCVNFEYMVLPVVRTLRVFDGNAPAMCHAWKVMHDLEVHVQGFTEAPFRLEQELATRALDAFNARWRLMLTDLHWAGGMLNPFLRGWAPLHENEHSRPILNRVLGKLVTSPEDLGTVLNQYQDFIENRGTFADSMHPRGLNVPPHEWWDAMGGGAKALQIIARRILAQVCSASACERNWSMYSYVHNKSRNRLKHSRAEDLVFIYTNSRLLRHRRGTRVAQWLELNGVHSDDESNGEDPDDANDEGQHPIDNDELGDSDMDDDNLGSDNGDSDAGGGGGHPVRNNTWGSDGQNSNDSGGGGDLGIFDFNEGEAPQQHNQLPSNLDRDDDRLSFGALCAGQGLWRDQEGARENPVVHTNVNLPSQPQSDSLSFGEESRPAPNQRGEEVDTPVPDTSQRMSRSDPNYNLSPQCTPTPIVQRVSTPSEEVLVNAAITEIGIPSEVGIQNRPLTRSHVIAGRTATVTTRGVGASLVALQTNRPNYGLGRNRRQANPLRGVQFPTIQRQPLCSASERGHVVRRVGRGSGIGGRGLTSSSDADINEVVDVPTTLPHCGGASSSIASGSGRRRTTRGTKRHRRNQGIAMPFIGENYDPSDGRPNLDDDGIRDVDGSRPTRRLVIGRDDNLQLRSGTPQSDDGESTDESDVDPRCIEENDPTIRMRT